MTKQPRETPRPAPDLALAAARAVEALGTNAFYDRLLDIIGGAVRHDLVALVRYARATPPDLILPRMEPTKPMVDYAHYFYQFDPFHLHWSGGGAPGVFRLRMLSPDVGRSLYAREFLAAMNINDEIAVFLPPVGEAAPTLVIDRAAGVFSMAEVARVQALFPLLAALHRSHVDRFVAEGLDHRASPFGSGRPLRLLDRDGRQIFATAGWIGAAADPAVNAALADLAERGPCTIRIAGGRMLRRMQMPPDFGAAPNGLCDDLIPDTAPAPALGGLPAAMAAKLTEREREVVLLTLQGHPVIGIARRMGVSPGTVKNHRLSIYRKLDITTERELFGEYLAEMRGF